MKVPKLAIMAVLVACFSAILWSAPHPAQAAVTWTQASTNGFGDAKNIRVTTLAQYGNKLYAGTLNSTTGAEVWAFNGLAWIQANTDGFGSANNTTIGSMTVYGSNLYASTLNSSTGAGIWKYDGTTWTQVNTGGFGDTRNYIVYTMAVYSNKLYAGTYNFLSGTEIWSYDGTTWTQVNTDGFGNPLNWYTDSLVVYKGNLLAGVANTLAGGQLWSYDGTTWTALNSDGFGDATNFEPFSAYVDGDTLYLGTWNEIKGAEVWTYNGSTFTQISADALGDINNKTILSINKYHGIMTFGVRNQITGAEVWTYNGGTWTQINADGFGDVQNGRAYNLTKFGPYLYAGSDNLLLGGMVWSAFMPETALGIVAAPAANGRTNIRVLDTAGKQLGSFFAYGTTKKMGVRVIQADLDGDQTNEIVTVPAAGAAAQVKAFELNGTLIASVSPYSSAFKGGASITAGDFNSDGRDEIAVAPLRGGGPKVRVYALNSAGNAFTLIQGFDAYPGSFKGGVNLASGDVIGVDGQDELIVAPYGDGRPNLRVYSFNVSTGKFSLVDWTLVYPQSFRDGVQVATGDINGDLQDEIMVLPQKNGRANLRVYYIDTSSKLKLLTTTLGYSNSYKGTVSLAVGDVDGNGLDEIVLAPKTNGRPKVAIFHYHDSKLSQLLTWSAYSDSFRGGVNLQVSDLDNDGQDEVITVPATGAKATIKIWDIDGSTARLVKSVLGYSGSFLGGVNLGQ